jgi:tRNA modification GTPase
VPINEETATIAAIATPPGRGGIGIIRISGPQAMNILQRLFVPFGKPTSETSFRNRHMYYGWIADGERDLPIDEVLAVYMRGPQTYTTEDVVEIQCHGSYLVLQEILTQIFAAGARPAGPGEFTKRAFLNGRIDLTQAEAVIDLIEARTREGLVLAATQMQGRLHQQIVEIRNVLISLRAVLEVAIDFPEEDQDIIDSAVMLKQLQDEAVLPLEKMIATADQGKIYREGISAVILGRPNVGKSSLLNCLLKEERALVTPVPGTTRDTIEEFINIKGMPVCIIDTAGIRPTEEIIEGMGIQRAKNKMATADLVLLIFDASEPLNSEDYQLYTSCRKENPSGLFLLVANKCDLPEQKNFSRDIKTLADEPLIRISAKKQIGIELLFDTIFNIMTKDGKGLEPGAAAVPNLRHKEALAKTLVACQRVGTGLQDGLPPDLLAIELQTALDHLGEVVGATTSEDVLDMIFDRFCIGK